jgi:hypothetical protein
LRFIVGSPFLKSARFVCRGLQDETATTNAATPKARTMADAADREIQKSDGPGILTATTRLTIAAGRNELTGFQGRPGVSPREETAYQCTASRRSPRGRLELTRGEIANARCLARAARKTANVRKPRASDDEPRAHTARDLGLPKFSTVRTFEMTNFDGRDAVGMFLRKIYQSSSIEARSLSVRFNTEMT